MDYDAWYEKLDPEARSEDPAAFLRRAFNAGLNQALLSFQQLTVKQQRFVKQWHYQTLLRQIADGGIKFKDQTLAEGITRAEAKCERMQTPWFLAGYIEDEVGDLLMQLATTEAEGCHYINPLMDMEVSNCVVPQD
jgi:O-glycosyl hydrolase